MTIDEAKEIIRKDALYSPDCAEFCIEALEELKWWREQDLVSREDIKDVSKMYFCKWDYNKCGSYSYCDQCTVLEINEIPKAEPPKENNQ